MTFEKIEELLKAATLAEQRGDYSDMEQCCYEALALLDGTAADDAGKASLYRSGAIRMLGVVAVERGDYPLAFGRYNEALAIAAAGGYDAAAASALSNIGIACAMTSEYTRSHEYFSRAMALFEQTGDEAGVGRVLTNIGLLYRNTADYTPALEYLGRALELHRRHSNRASTARDLGNIGSVFSRMGDLTQALEYYTEALAEHEALGMKAAAANTLGNIATLYRHLGDYPRSMEYNGQALAIHETLGLKEGIARTLGNMANVYTQLEDYAVALDYYSRALDLYDQLGNRVSIARIVGSMGNCCLHLRNYVAARAHLTRALDVLGEAGGHKEVLAFLTSHLGALYATEDYEERDDVKAEELLLKTIATFTELGAKRGQYENHKFLADLYERQKRWEEFAVHFKKYHDIKEDVRNEETKKKAGNLDFERKTAVREKQIAVERARAQATQELLHNTLPPEIADRLLAGERIADAHHNVSVLFADIVDFTRLSQTLTAKELVEGLDFLFTTFDDLAEKHGLEKIKTIGDCYMAIAGAPAARADHAEAIAAMALEMMDAAAGFRAIATGEPIRLRIGLHSGEVVAGVIGRRKYTYDLWGDAVNTASRMESHGEAGKIHCSEAFARELGFRNEELRMEEGDAQLVIRKSSNSLRNLSQFVISSRGEMDVKGKGRMTTYFLEGVKISVVVVLLIFCVCSSIQAYTFDSPRTIDSLKRVAESLPADTAKVSVLNRIARANAMLGQREAARDYANQALNLATSLGWKSGIAMAYNRLGNSYDGNPKQAYYYYAKALRIWQKLSDKRLIAIGLANVSNAAPDTAEAHNFARQSLNTAQESGDSSTIARAHWALFIFYFNKKNDVTNALMHTEKMLAYHTSSEEARTVMIRNSIAGLVYLRPYAYAKALQCHLKALEIAKLVDDTSYIAQASANTGLVYYYLKQYAKALEYHESGRQFWEAIGAKSGVVSVMSTMCEIYKMLPDDAKTIAFCNQTLRYIGEMREDKMRSEEIVVYRVFAEVYRQQKRFAAAVHYGKKALDFARHVDDLTEQSYSMKELGLCLLDISLDPSALLACTKNQQDSLVFTATYDALVPAGKHETLRLAQRYLVQSLEISQRTQQALHDVSEECYYGLTQTAKLLGDYQKAIEYYDGYIHLKNSTYSRENNNNISILEMQQAEENIKKQEQIAALEIEKVSNEKKIYGGGILALGLLSLLLYNRYRLKNKANEIITLEKARSENLLLNILPAEVADELKAKGSAEAKHFDNVTVLFTDFKSFTTVSEQLSPQELVNELHACFKGFDEICGKYNIEKIKTIGDAYLAVCGLPLADERHAENVVNAAIEIRDFMQNRSKEIGEKTFEIRIGINSGSVVAGIVGVKKFAYDIWGDAVNTAARMEQNSEAGKINISETTFELIKGKFPCEYRGEIDAKNKGKLKMYFVE